MTKEIEWYEHFTLPPHGNMMQPGPNDQENFVRIGNEISGNIHAALCRHIEEPLSSLQILEFGCGIGRLVMPLQFRHRYPSDAVDVSGWCISWLNRNVPNVNFKKTENDPPLPFADNSFDAIYSVSVWTHLPFDRQVPWLQEIHRILKPGGLALISTSGYRALKYRREERKQPEWINISDDDLRREGMMYSSVDIRNHDGVEGEYGYVAHDPDYVMREWSEIFDVVEQTSAGVGRMQDLNVLRKRTA
ncbi:MAG: methyltransferase domain-containing protein [Pseudomonadota bacterium]